MKIIIENVSISDFDAWSGAIDTKNRIVEKDMETEFDSMIEDQYPDGLTDTQLNDILWHDSTRVLEDLGIPEEYSCTECGSYVPEDDWDDDEDMCTSCAEEQREEEEDEDDEEE